MKRTFLVLMFLTLLALALPVPAEVDATRSEGTPTKGVSPSGPLPPPVDTSDPELIPGKCYGAPSARYLEICASEEFRSLVIPCQQDPSYPPPGLEEQWRSGMEPFVPCLIEALSSDDPCVPLAAIKLLDKTGDDRAVEPLLQILNDSKSNGRVERLARGVLVRRFRSVKVVPNLIAALEEGGELLSCDLHSCRFLPPDSRLIEVLVRLYEKQPYPYKKLAILRLIVQHASESDVETLLKPMFQEWKGFEGTHEALPFLIERVADAETADDIMDYYFTHYRHRKECHRIVEAIEGIGPDAQLAFHRRGFESTYEPQKQEWATDLFNGAIRHRAPPSFPYFDGFSRWVADQVMDLLPYVGTKEAHALLERCSDFETSAPAIARAAFLEKAAELFNPNPEVQAFLLKDLSDLYRSVGSDGLEKSLEAIQRAIDLPVERRGHPRPPPPQWAEKRDHLRSILSRREMLGSLSVRIKAYEPDEDSQTILRAEMTIPSEAPWDLASEHPFCYIDFRDSEGTVTTVPGTIEQYRPIGGKDGAQNMEIRLVLEGPAPPESDVEIRIRLLFLSFGDGFRGVVSSEFAKR